ncbi:MAG: hydroxymethylbilane synthase [Verrucomicrobiales bacterium]
MPFRIGTRGSELALAQADMVEVALRTADCEVDLRRVIIKTTGDLRPDLRLTEFSQGEAPILDKGIFTKELEVALAAGEIDAVVHSLKDVPTQLGGEFEIAAVLPRATEDVLLSNHPGGFGGLPEGATVATSSVRRARLLRWKRPDLKIAEIRGNVPTRIRKLREAEHGFDATVLARAGLERLGINPGGECVSFELLPLGDFPPAAGQGAVAIEIRRADGEARARLAAINHAETFQRITAERALLHLLDAGCHTPVAIDTRIEGGTLHLRALVFDENDADAAPKIAAATAPAEDATGGRRRRSNNSASEQPTDFPPQANE